MNKVLLSIMVPAEVVTGLDAKLEEVRKIHNRQLEKARNLAATQPNEKNVTAAATLQDRSRNITRIHVLRALVTLGLERLVKPEDLLARMASDTVRVGRPPDGVRAA